MSDVLPVMNAYDWIVVLVVLLSMAVGMLRGFTRELGSIGAWIGAFIAARQGAAPLAAYAEHALENSAVRLALSFIVIFVITLIVIGLIGQWLAQAVRKVGLRPVDRLLGAAFGVVRAALILMLLVTLAALIGITEQKDWRHAWSTAWLEKITARGTAILPAALAERIHLHGARAPAARDLTEEG